MALGYLIRFPAISRGVSWQRIRAIQYSCFNDTEITSNSPQMAVLELKQQTLICPYCELVGKNVFFNARGQKCSHCWRNQDFAPCQSLRTKKPCPTVCSVAMISSGADVMIQVRMKKAKGKDTNADYGERLP